MATSNRHSATIHPAPPHHLPTATPPPPPFHYLKIFVIIVLFMIMFVPFIFITLHPYFEIISVSATPLSPTVPSAWNLTLKVSNSNPIWKIYYDRFHVAVFYSGNDNYDNVFQSKLIGETVVGPIWQKKWSNIMFYPTLIVYTESSGSMVVERIMEDKKLGSLSFQVRVSFRMKFNIRNEKRDMERIFCRDLKMVFDNSGLGIAIDLPRKCHFVWMSLY